MDNETIIEIVKVLADNGLLLIDNKETLQECSIEIHHKKKNNGKEVVLFIAKAN